MATTITIKYNIGENVFFLHNNKIQNTEILNFNAAQIIGQPLSVRYALKNKLDDKGKPLTDYPISIPEELLFSSKQKLIESL